MLSVNPREACSFLNRGGGGQERLDREGEVIEEEEGGKTGLYIKF